MIITVKELLDVVGAGTANSKLLKKGEKGDGYTTNY